MSELRAHTRYAIELECELDIEERKLRGRTHDISRGGFCMLMPSDAAMVSGGAPCVIRLSLVFSETEFSEQLTLQGVVMWCTRLKQGTQVGVRFQPLDAASLNYLDLFIRFLGEEDGDDPPPKSSNDQE